MLKTQAAVAVVAALVRRLMVIARAAVEAALAFLAVVWVSAVDFA
jgi:hypothetical protein